MSTAADIIEGDVFRVGEVELEVVACDHDHGMYALSDLVRPEVAHLVVMTSAQLAANR